MNNNPNYKNMIKGAILIFLILLAINLSNVFNNNDPTNKILEVDYTTFLENVSSKKIKDVVIIEKLRGPREIKVTPKEGAVYSFNSPFDATLIQKLVDNNVSIVTKEEPKPSWFSSFLSNWGPTILYLGVFIWLIKGATSGAGGKGLFSINKSKAKLIDPDKINVTFKDVVGCDEAKQEIQEFVDFLKNPDKFSKLGGRIPHGLLLTGPPGTGKTLLAKALAKESGVPFFSMSGSDFIEMFVGVGASRVRDMFEHAKKVAPCVLFIDEIDAIGGKRGSGSFGGGHDEREQTLNQILVELDGMDTNKGVILVGATNRPETLDSALLRPDRIDRQITVTLPDVNGREEILKIHSKNVPLSNNCDLRKIGRGTPGFSGAELANLINEAAILAARRESKFVEHIDLEKAKDKILMGVERPTLAMSEEDKKDTAFHESGHAVVVKLIKESDPLYKVTIIPRGRALGVTIQLPEKDRWSYKKQYLLDRIAILMGGRAAEEIFCNTMTNGASNDISVATSTARAMVMEWGMSKMGPMAYGDRQSSHLGNSGINTSGISPDTLKEIDVEVRSIIEEQYLRAYNILFQHQDVVHSMANALIEVETLDEWQIENIMNHKHYNESSELINLEPVNNEIIIVDGKDVFNISTVKDKDFTPDSLTKPN